MEIALIATHRNILQDFRVVFRGINLGEFNLPQISLLATLYRNGLFKLMAWHRAAPDIGRRATRCRLVALTQRPV